MRIRLVDLGSISSWKNDSRYTPKSYIPLGLLRIGAVAEARQHNVDLVSVDQYTNFISSPRALHDKDDIVNALSKKICDQQYEILGFSTRVDSLAAAIVLASRYKKKYGNTKIVFGGPGSDFIDQEILERFPAVDIIVRGEGEDTFAELLDTLEGGGNLSAVSGITYRRQDKTISKNPMRPYIANLDNLPEPAYHLLKEEFLPHKVVFIDIEVGRGCSLGCAFCSTNLFWGNKVRMRSAEIVVNEMETLGQKLGSKTFRLVHDNVLCNRRFVREFCDLIRKRHLSIQWGMQASVSLCTPEVVKMVAEAGCNSVFIGIETAGDGMATYLPNKFRSIDEVKRAVETFREHNIGVTSSFIIGFPDETVEDIEATLRMGVDLEATAPMGRAYGGTRFSSLCIYPGTKVYEACRDRLKYSSELNRMTPEDINNSLACKELVSHYPTVFTQYACWDMEKQNSSVRISGFARTLIKVFPKSLAILLHQLEMSCTKFIDYFRNYLQEQGQDTSCFDKPITDFFPSLAYDSIILFPECMQNIYRERCVSSTFVELFCSYEKLTIEKLDNPPPRLINESLFNDSKQVPIVPKATKILTIDFDPDKTFHQFLEYETTTPVTRDKPLNLCFYHDRMANFDSTISLRPFRLNEGTEAIIPALIRYSDGDRTIADIIEASCREEGISVGQPFLIKAIVHHLKTLIRCGALLLQSEV